MNKTDEVTFTYKIPKDYTLNTLEFCAPSSFYVSLKNKHTEQKCAGYGDSVQDAINIAIPK